MTVADEAAGWAEAQRRIEACRETRGEELDLGGLQLTRVPEELGELVNLISLDLAGNNIGDDGARALAGLVKLTSLDLAINEIGDDGARALAGLVKLTSLDLAINEIGDDGARALAGLVKLTSLDLPLNEIGDDGARALAGLVNLTSLNLSGNAIGDDGGAVAHGHGRGGREGRPGGHLLARRVRLLRRGHEGRARLSSRPGARTGPARSRCLAWAATPQSCWSAP